ncbi:unnamed protein product [Gongylonema pulchrum]|uniref:Neur_chan_memb domain-containing protein n=1 Tax=Gongylonema pulchrum TaxID=637853 RepID=A0A183ELE8_9BILA|nr:unnamed protein product [Gongylonema pulchrum]
MLQKAIPGVYSESKIVPILVLLVVIMIYDMNRDPNEPERVRLEDKALGDSSARNGNYALKYTEERMNMLSSTHAPKATTTARISTSSSPDAFTVVFQHRFLIK